MTRPNIIRADTIDLQDAGSPSAADHSRQPTQPAPLGVGPAAPHQAAAVRHVEHDRASEQDGLVQAWTSPNGRGRDDDYGATDSTDLTDDGDMAMADSETDDVDVDDDMLEKISSSPSIDDGRCFPSSSASRASAWPTRSASLCARTSPSSSPLPATPPQQHTYQHRFASPESDQGSSSPYTLTPQYLPLSYHPHYSSTPPDLSTPLSSPPPATPPAHSPTFSPARSGGPSSADYHRLGEYTTTGPATRNHLFGHERRQDFGPLAGWQYERDSDESVSTDGMGEKVPAFPSDRPSPLFPISNSTNNLREESLKTYQSTLLPEPEDVVDVTSWETDSDASSFDPNNDDDHDDDDHDDNDDDDSKDNFLFLDPDRHDSAYGGECLREIEDIDFEFVYALHTFIATVEGQANATKGDTMVLLDDSNSYWWLVRLVKDSSIGYLPAEHIETPTERLARLNKHRNIDLSAAMLGDAADKPKNPLKKAIRRRNAKTVQFAMPTYIEASDYDYSSEEDEEGEEEEDDDHDGGDAHDAQTHVDDEPEYVDDAMHDTMTVEPLRIVAKERKKDEPTDEPKSSDDDARASDDGMSNPPPEQKVSRNGTVRNTDSFFKDDTAETRKITITPNILRDDSSASTVRSEGRETGGSLDSLEKELKSPEKPKDDRKRREKKPGMLRGLFGRKDKRSKAAESETNEEKQSEEPARDPPSRHTEARPSPKEPAKAEKESNRQEQPMRQMNKTPRPLEKATNGPHKSQPSNPNLRQLPKPILQKPSTQGTAEVTMRVVSVGPEQGRPVEKDDSHATAQAQERPGRPRNTSSSTAKRAISSMLHPKSEKLNKSKVRAPLDDFDSTPEYEQHDPLARPGEEEDKVAGSPGPSPVETDMPPLVNDTSSQDEPDASPQSPSDSSFRDEASSITGPAAATSHAPTILDTSVASAPASSPTSSGPPSAASLPTWSDASLRSYLDDGSDVRDMLVVVNDTSGVVPVGPDHPIMAGLFTDERNKVTEMGMHLDSLLGDWLSRKRRRNEGVGKQSV